ncbi:MAG: xanthine phosphoribosyltransferase, partial [Clostridia bacterium]
MKELVEAIRARGVGIGTEIVKVDMFLNHRLDTDLFVKMGQAFADAFLAREPDLVLTVEASGIAAALTTAMACGNIPVVFAKKSRTRNVTGDVYESRVFSFTHGVENHIHVAKEYLPKGAKVLIVDDFLANGEAAEGLCDLVKQAGATVVGIGICVEKSFQPGHQKLVDEGYDVVALAKVTGIEDG